MTKTRTKKGVTDPFKPVNDIQFSYSNFTLYELHQDTFNQFATETARRIIKSGSSDEFRQLHLYIVSINEWNNYAFHRIVGTATLLHDYYKIIPSYPILKGFHDAVLNAVEYSYVNWLNNELIPILPDVTSDILHQRTNETFLKV